MLDEQQEPDDNLPFSLHEMYSNRFPPPTGFTYELNSASLRSFAPACTQLRARGQLGSIR